MTPSDEPAAKPVGASDHPQERLVDGF